MNWHSLKDPSYSAVFTFALPFPSPTFFCSATLQGLLLGSGCATLTSWWAVPRWRAKFPINCPHSLTSTNLLCKWESRSSAFCPREPVWVSFITVMKYANIHGNLGKKEFLPAHSSNLQSITARRPQRQPLEIAAHVSSMGQQQRARNKCMLAP